MHCRHRSARPSRARRLLLASSCLLLLVLACGEDSKHSPTGSPAPDYLAKKILRLSGSPGVVDRDIVFTGLRPGEKLHEELVAPDEETVETPLGKAKIVLQTRPFGGGLVDDLLRLEGRAEPLSEDDVRGLLESMIPAWGREAADLQPTGSLHLKRA